MTITIELPDELAARLVAAGIPAEDASRYALAALADVVDRAEVRAWWHSLSEKEKEAERATSRDSLAAGDAGHSTPASEVYARIRDMHASGSKE